MKVEVAWECKGPVHVKYHANKLSHLLCFLFFFLFLFIYKKFLIFITSSMTTPPSDARREKLCGTFSDMRAEEGGKIGAIKGKKEKREGKKGHNNENFY